MIFLFIIFSSLFCTQIFPAEISSDSSIEQILNQKLNRPLAKEDSFDIDALQAKISFSQEESDAAVDVEDTVEEDEKTIDLNVDAADLTSVIHNIAREKGVNIILPTGANAITSKLTFRSEERVSVRKAWKFLYTILDIAGYSVVKRLEGYAIVKNNADVARNPLPIYIGVAPDDLPKTDKRIKYIYYLSNIQVPDFANARQSELNRILDQVLPKPTSVYKYMPAANGLLMVAKASDIRGAMKIVLELDKVGFREKLEIMKLRHSSAQIVADLFNRNILAAAQPTPANRRRLGWRKKSQAEYFSKNVKIIPEFRTNSLLVLGREQAIERIREFVYKYIDLELESGKSILHTYQLKYLDAEPFARTLQRIVQSASTGGTGQSRVAGTATGPERFFEGVIIKTDTPPPTEKGGEQVYSGSNQLIIAARNDDWLRIKSLIEELDRPQPQVIIEVLIADLTISDERLLGSHTRTPAALNLPKVCGDNLGVQFQSAQPGPAVASGTTPDGSLHPDLLRSDFVTSDGSTTIDPLTSVATGAAGIMSLNDSNGDAWSILQVLQSYENSKILSHPHVVAINNKEAKVEIGETRLQQADATIGTGGAAIAKKDEVNANLTVTITPRITSGKMVNLQVSVDFKEFIGDTVNRIDRKVTTNANVKDGSILALGGLIKIDTNQGVNKTPLLGRLPLIGWLFKKRSGSRQKNNLTVFIRPTVVESRLRGGMDRYTRGYIDVAKEYAGEGMLFDTLREPVTRWFFKTGVDATKAIDVFAEESLYGLPELDGAVREVSGVEVSRFRNNPHKTVLAAIEGRDDFIDVPDQPVERVATSQKLDDHPPRELVVAQKNEPNKQDISKVEASVVQKKKSLSKDEQLRNLLASHENPLLNS